MVHGTPGLKAGAIEVSWRDHLTLLSGERGNILTFIPSARHLVFPCFSGYKLFVYG